MRKTYFNDAIIGNSKMLGCLTKSGELVRLFWPNIDFSQHIEYFHFGIFKHSSGNSNNIYWLHDGNWQHNQLYIEDTNVLETVFEDTSLGIMVRQTDFILIERDIFVRKCVIKNISREVNSAKLILNSSMISNSNNLRSTVFEYNADSLVYFRHDNYIAISSDTKISDFTIGDEYENSYKEKLLGVDDVAISANANLEWQLGELNPGQTKEIVIYLHVAKTLKDCLEGIKEIKKVPASTLLNDTIEYWREFLKKAKILNIKNIEIHDLYKRSVLTFALMSDKQHGGLLAAPEVDEEFTRCGRYAYCWGRDAAFITIALDKCGLTSVTRKFYEWCFLTQTENGSWYQRYYLDGNLAPSWGLQIDETGSILWGIWEHYSVTKDIVFLEISWQYVKKAADFLVDFIDDKTGLPELSYDLWEERVAEHAYSSAAVYGGLIASSKIAEVLKKSDVDGNSWFEEANSIRNAIEKNFWDKDEDRFLRSIKVRPNPRDRHRISDLREAKTMDRLKHYALKDKIVDSSLIGLSTPFNVFAAGHEYMVKTVDAIEKHLMSHKVGGIKRYEDDGYIGGNPWILTTLWLALYHIKVGNIEKAKEYFSWAVDHRTELDFLPEQIDKETGKPAWVIPLTWSHAMFILVLFGLIEKGEEL